MRSGSPPHRCILQQQAASFPLERIEERKLFQWAVAYLAGAWLLLQVLELLGEPFAWPDVVLQAATVLLAVGFFGVLVLAWYHGEQGRQRASGVELVMLAGILLLATIAACPDPPRGRGACSSRAPRA